jgi:ribosomal-protein-alanine N-acetyltransferase
VLTTQRLILRDFVESDLEAVCAFWCDPEVTRWTDYAADTRHEAEQWLESVIFHNQQQPRLAYNLAISMRQDERVIGWIGIGPAARTDPAEGELSAGFCLRREWWGRGLMTEALRAIIGFVFQSLGARRVSAQCYPANVASARVMEKAGMRFEGEYPMPGGDGEVRVYRRYAVAAERWRA